MCVALKTNVFGCTFQGPGGPGGSIGAGGIPGLGNLTAGAAGGAGQDQEKVCVSDKCRILRSRGIPALQRH